MNKVKVEIRKREPKNGKTYLYLEYDKSLIAANSEEDNEYKVCNAGWGDPKTHALKYKLSNYITSTDTISTLPQPGRAESQAGAAQPGDRQRRDADLCAGAVTDDTLL